MRGPEANRQVILEKKVRKYKPSDKKNINHDKVLKAMYERSSYFTL